MLTLQRAPTREYRTAIMDSRRWDAFAPRRGDIVIATFPKCGTTWMQRIVDLLIFQTPAPRPMVSLAPWLDATFFAPVEQDLATLAAQTHRRFVKTHLPFDSVPIWEGVKYIHVGRDGRDACMSMHNHALGFRPEMRQRIADIVQADPRLSRQPNEPRETPSDPREYYLEWIANAEADTADTAGVELPFFEFETTYWRERRRPNLLFVHYNDLKSGLAAEMRRIAAFLEIDTPEAVMPELVQAATFEAMKRDGATLLPVMERAFDRGADRFLHKGTNDRWKDVLTPDDLARYDALEARKPTPANAAWISQGRLGAGDPRQSPD